MKRIRNIIFALAVSFVAVAVGDYTHTASYSMAGVYEIAQPDTDVVLTGEINGEVTLTLPENCRVTLSGVALSGTLSINGDAELWLVGENAVSTAGATAISCSGSLTVAGEGSLAAAAAGAKKTGVVSAASLTVAGGTTALTISNPTAKNACGVSLSGDYTQTGGTLRIVGASGDYKQNGVFLSKKNTKATITGGTLDVTLAGEKSVGLAMDKVTVSGTMSGGTLKFAMSGDGAKGVKGDGSFTMTGGTLEATLSGGVAEDYFEYEDGNGTTWNYYVKLTSSTKTSGGTASYSTSALIANGTYPVMDPSKCYAVKVGTLEISGGAVTVTATGTAGRGLGADNMTLSGGTYDITVAGGPTDVYVESLVESDELDDTTYAGGVATCLDSGGAACLKTSGTDGILTISGGTFALKATGNAGKLINAAGYLVIGAKGQSTLPADSSFSPNISGSTTGSKVYCTAVKQKYYGTLAVATATTDIGNMALSTASANIVKSSSPSSQTGVFGGGPGNDDNADYSNPKGVKGYSGVTVYGGRLAISTKNDGGEGLESKNALTINGGVIDLQCYDDCINSGGDLYINGGYIYALSSGNDAIDSNASIYMTGGVVLAFSTAGGPEVGIDTDSSSGLVISGGHLVAVGAAAGNMVVGSSGSQKTYVKTSISASTCSGKYLSITGTDTFTVKMPYLSGTISLVCTTEGWTSAKSPSVSTTAPSSGALGFHDAYLSGFSGSDTPQPTYYTVTLGKNGGIGGDNYVTATYGSAMPTPRTAPKKAGYTFDGYWDTTKDGGKQYYDADMKSVRNWDKTTTFTIWAKWVPVSYKVTFGKNGGTSGDNYVTATYGSAMPTPRTAPKKAGYIFDGYWDTTKEGGRQYYNADMKSVRNWDKTTAVTLWAKWVPAHYKVTLGKNGGTGGDNYVTATYAATMPTPRTAPKLNGWTFDGYWDTIAADANGNPLGKQYYDRDMKSVRNWDKTTPVTLWAKWTVKVTLGKNGGSGGDDSVVVTRGRSFPKSVMPTRTGYTFGGYWVSSSNRTGQCYNADGTGTASIKWTTGGTPTIWALWTKTSSLVEATPPVAAQSASAAPTAANSAELSAGLYSGVLADGTGTFCLMLDEAGEDCVRTAFLYIASEYGAFTAECVAVELDGVLILTTEDGTIYDLDPVACMLINMKTNQ